MAWEVPCLAAAVQLSVASATTQPIKPALASAIKGERSFLLSSTYLETRPPHHVAWLESR